MSIDAHAATKTVVKNVGAPLGRPARPARSRLSLGVTLGLAVVAVCLAVAVIRVATAGYGPSIRERQATFDADLRTRLVALEGVAAVHDVAPRSYGIQLVGGTGDAFEFSRDELWSRVMDLDAETREAQVRACIVELDAHIRDMREVVDVKQERVLPLVRSAAWVAAADAETAQSPERALLREPLAGDLVVTWAVDGRQVTRSLVAGDLVTLHIDLPQLDARAKENFARIAPSYTLERQGAIWLVKFDGTYDGSLLLYPTLWLVMRSKVEGNPVACYPAPGVLAVTGSEDPLGPPSMRNLIDQMQTGNNPVSTTMLEWQNGVWTVFAKVETAAPAESAPAESAPPVTASPGRQPQPEAADAPQRL